MSVLQKTLADSVEFEGIGIHTGIRSRIVIKPADEDHGLVFASGGSLIPAGCDYVISTKRSTVLGCGGVSVSTVEHLLAALSGLGISNALIEIDGPEIPILDGSADLFCKRLLAAGLKAQSGVREVLELAEPVFVSKEDSLVLAMPCSELILEGDVSYPSPQVGHQNFSFRFSGSFARELAPARTFGFWSEVKALLEAGLGQGGDLSNALIFDRPGFDASLLRFPDEPARHKVLDLAGDLALLGRPLHAHVLAVRAGHRLHVEFVRKLARIMNKDA